jgi:hypothetical protein
MRELQSIGYEMSVTFCYRHYCPSVAAYHRGNGIDVGVRVEAPLASVVAGARICHVAARLHGGIALRVGRALISFSLDSLAPTHPRDPRLPSEQPKKELTRRLMLVTKLSRSPTPNSFG